MADPGLHSTLNTLNMPKDCPDCTPKKLCRWHERRKEAAKMKPIPRSPLKKKDYKIKRESSKRAKQNRQYAKEVKPWKEENSECKARLPGCTGRTKHAHHMMGKENHLLLIKKYWLPVCPPCHDKITLMPIEQAIEQGLSLRRNVEIEKRK